MVLSFFLDQDCLRFIESSFVAETLKMRSFCNLLDPAGALTFSPIFTALDLSFFFTDAADSEWSLNLPSFFLEGENVYNIIYIFSMISISFLNTNIIVVGRRM